MTLHLLLNAQLLFLELLSDCVISRNWHVIVFQPPIWIVLYWEQWTCSERKEKTATFQTEARTWLSHWLMGCQTTVSRLSSVTSYTKLMIIEKEFQVQTILIHCCMRLKESLTSRGSKKMCNLLSGETCLCSVSVLAMMWITPSWIWWADKTEDLPVEFLRVQMQRFNFR